MKCWTRNNKRAPIPSCWKFCYSELFCVFKLFWLHDLILVAVLAVLEQHPLNSLQDAKQHEWNLPNITSVFKCLWISRLLAGTAQRHLLSPNYLISLLVLSPNQKSAPSPPCSVVQRKAQVYADKKLLLLLKRCMCTVQKAANTSFKVSPFSVRFGLVGVLKHRKTYIYITELIPPASFGLLSLTDVRFLLTT